MPQLEHIEAIEKRLWSSADNLRANSNYASNEYFLPVMGLIFLRHAYSRYLGVKDAIEAGLPKRGGKTRPLTKDDFARKTAIFLRPEAQFDFLLNLPGGKFSAQSIIDAMEAIEADYEGLKGVLPKVEYQGLDKEVLKSILRTFNDPALEKADGDVFGRIYEYFLTQFADLKAHDNGEFFTPVSLVQTIVNVIEPDHGTVLDPACGSGGMFVQSAHFIERLHKNPFEQVTFYGMEKNPTTIRLALMNLAVHGLEGNIQKAITYYEDPHELCRKADFVMANPPFNVDEVDSEKIKSDPRLPFGLPGVNKKKAVSNGNYLWISYFYSYLNDTGRAGFVMSSQASSAGRDEATVRQKLVETGHVDVMIAIRSNFFYTRTVPCELWFFDRAKPEGRRDKVLMIDARNIYRKVTRKINDFTPEQLKNLSSIVWLYRGQENRFLELVHSYLVESLQITESVGEALAGFDKRYEQTIASVTTYLKEEQQETAARDVFKELKEAAAATRKSASALVELAAKLRGRYLAKLEPKNTALHKAAEALAPLRESCRDVSKDLDLVYKLVARLVDYCEKELNAKASDRYNAREINKLRKALDDARKEAVEQLRLVRYFYKQAEWLQERFPEAILRNVEGLVKLVTIDEIKKNDWSLTPGRYVGVAPEEEEDGFDFEEALREIHGELKGLNEEAAELAARIEKNFEELGV